MHITFLLIKNDKNELKTTNKFDILKIGVPDFSAQDRILTKTFLTQNMSSKKNQDFLFLPLPSELGSMKNDQLNQKLHTRSIRL